jgi:hypothetical protein
MAPPAPPRESLTSYRDSGRLYRERDPGAAIRQSARSATPAGPVTSEGVLEQLFRGEEAAAPQLDLGDSGHGTQTPPGRGGVDCRGGGVLFLHAIQG